VSGLELCPKCKKGHLYPVVTARVSAEPKGQYRETSSIRDYQCDICGHKQKPGKKTQSVGVKDKLSARVIKAKRTKPKPKPKPKAKKTKSRKRKKI
jgi:hypothetical protein